MPNLMTDWKWTVCSEVNRDFVSNPYPVVCECITVAIRMSKDAPVKRVWIRGITEGVSFRIPMDVPEQRGCFIYFQVNLEMEKKRLNYRFELETPDGFFYYTSAGVQRVCPTEEHNFVIMCGMRNPEWVPGAVFYQIFPDRFREGDPSIGVVPEEYQYDGAMTSVIPWGQEPPEYEEGRCVDFYNGDLAGIEQAIPHFKELHVDALYINPIFSAKTNHRYDCTDYFHVDEHIGGDDALISLMEHLHEVEIRAILDVSINHTGIEHVWFKKAQHDPDSEEAGFYDRFPSGLFSYWLDVPTLPQLNYKSELLRRYIWKDNDSLVRHYLKAPFKIDGWRFDVANQVGTMGGDHYCHRIWRGIHSAVKNENAQAYIIGEDWEDSIDFLQGDQWDSAMNYFASCRPIRSWLGELDRYLMHNYGGEPESGRAITGSELQQALEQHLSRLPNQLQFLQFNLLDSHDTARFYHHTAIWDWGLYQGALYLLFSLPGAVSYFYGDEIALNGHSRSVEGSRYAMEWDRSKWDMKFFTLYSRLGELRHTYHDVFAYGAFRTLYTEDELYSCVRFLGEQAIVTILNRRNVRHEYAIPVNLIGAVSCESLMQDVSTTITDQVLHIVLNPKEPAIIICRCAV